VHVSQGLHTPKAIYGPGLSAIHHNVQFLCLRGAKRGSETSKRQITVETCSWIVIRAMDLLPTSLAAREESYRVS